MKDFNQLNLPKEDIQAVRELKRILDRKFPEAEIILYGSKAREENIVFSDIDVLILINDEVNNSLREEIYSISYDIELEHNVVFGILVESKKFWNSSIAKAMSIHENIEKDGIPVV